MCREYGITGDMDFINSVLPRYMDLLERNPNAIISQSEANDVLARALHCYSEDDLDWIGGEQRVMDLVNTLETLGNF